MQNQVHPTINPSTTIPALNAESTQPIPNKIHMRGLDNLTSSDIKAYAAEYLKSISLEKVEWIDDTSANLVFATPEIALEALKAIAADESNDASLLQILPARPFHEHPEARLEVRLAVSGDRKQAGARDRSRFYLLNPEHDRAERRKTTGYGRRDGRRYRDRDEYRPRGRQDVEDFDASLYDDDEVSRAVRASKSRSRAGSRSSISSGEYQGHRGRRDRRMSARELFPDRIARRNGPRLLDRDRSASPVNNDGRLRRSESASDSTANRLKAQMIKARLKETAPAPKELFPQKTSAVHRRSDAFDAADATADLFANKMPVPFVDGSSDFSSKKSRDLISRIAAPSEGRLSSTNPSSQGFSIRGAAKQQPATEFSIKGIAKASGGNGKELFPERTGQNSGKELFSGKLEGRGGRRRKAEDLFY